MRKKGGMRWGSLNLWLDNTFTLLTTYILDLEFYKSKEKKITISKITFITIVTFNFKDWLIECLVARAPIYKLGHLKIN